MMHDPILLYLRDINAKVLKIVCALEQKVDNYDVVPKRNDAELISVMGVIGIEKRGNGIITYSVNNGKENMC